MSATHLIVSSQLKALCRYLVMTSPPEYVFQPARLFKELMQQVRLQGLDVGTSKLALWDWFQRQCDIAGRELQHEVADAER